MSIAVAFIIFAGAVFTLQISSVQDTVKMLLGADLNLVSFGGYEDHALPQVLPCVVCTTLPRVFSEAGVADVWLYGYVSEFLFAGTMCCFFSPSFDCAGGTHKLLEQHHNRDV